MKLLLVNNQFQLGGAETVVQQIWSRIPHARLLVAEAATPPVEVMYPRLLSRLSHSRFHGLTEKWFPMFEWTNRHFAELRNDPADIIHIHNFHGGYASVEALAGLARTKRVIWTFHGLWGVTGGCDHAKGCRRYLDQCGNCPQLGAWPIGDVDRTAEELSRKFAALAGLPLEVIAPSRYFHEVIRSSPIGRNWTVHHIPNGIDATKFKPAQTSSDRLSLLVVNRHFQDPHKGFAMVLQALNHIDPKGIQLTFVGLNSGWAIEQLQEGFETRDLGYLTDRKRLAELYAESDIFPFASPAENFPCVILEAMASGCCVVATPSGGIVEQITDGQTGFLGSAVSGQALAEALCRALKARSELRDFGLRARTAVIDKFSEDSMIESHCRVYEKKLSVVGCQLSGGTERREVSEEVVSCQRGRAERGEVSEEVVGCQLSVVRGDRRKEEKCRRKLSVVSYQLSEGTKRLEVSVPVSVGT
jgi:glycosyltransferase involved in cell wall biosynthesis